MPKSFDTMFRFLIIIISNLFLLSCEMSSVSVKSVNSKDVMLDVTQKKITFNFEPEDSFQNNLVKNFEDWFNSNVLASGLDGHGNLIFEKLSIKEVNDNGLYRIEVDLEVKYKIFKNNNNLRKIHTFNLSNWSEIEGEFSIKDKETINDNLINKLIVNISNQLNVI